MFEHVKAIAIELAKENLKRSLSNESSHNVSTVLRDGEENNLPKTSVEGLGNTSKDVPGVELDKP